MITISVDNVNDALKDGIKLIHSHGVAIPSRNGATLEVPEPVSTVYHRPYEKVLLSKVRDANPFFHLMEAMWILAGRSDVKFLSEFNKRIVNYSDDGVVFNAPYGYRMRSHFHMDQVEEVVSMLKSDPGSRQAVCQIWDPDDLPLNVKDKACNLGTVFRIRNSKLDITVFNRSNDMVWGTYGANAVQFSMLQEYVAAKIGIPVGTYTQVSNSYHVYTSGDEGKGWDKLKQDYVKRQAPYPKQLVLLAHHDIGSFDNDLALMFKVYDEYGLEECARMNTYTSEYFRYLIIPMLKIYTDYKAGMTVGFNLLDIVAADWRLAASDWIANRLEYRTRNGA